MKLMLKQCPQAMLKQCTKHVHVRTYGLTKNYSPLVHVLTLSNAHRGAAKYA